MNSDARIGFFFCLPFIIFAFLSGLKIGEVIDWSWWWITATIWIPAIILAMWIVPVAIFAFTFIRMMEGSHRK